MPLVWERAVRPFEPALLEPALEALDRLRGTESEQILVHQDLHGNNVLQAMREPWLVIDPKPLVGEREFHWRQSSVTTVLGTVARERHLSFKASSSSY